MTAVAYCENSVQYVPTNPWLLWHADCTKINFGRDSTPYPAMGAYDAPRQTPIPPSQRRTSVPSEDGGPKCRRHLGPPTFEPLLRPCQYAQIVELIQVKILFATSVLILGALGLPWTQRLCCIVAYRGFFIASILGLGLRRPSLRGLPTCIIAGAAHCLLQRLTDSL